MAEIIKRNDTKEVLVRIVNQMIFIRNDLPIETPVNGLFETRYPFVQGTLIVSLNGLRQREGSSYDYVVVNDREFQFNNPLSSDDTVIVDYIKILNN